MQFFYRKAEASDKGRIEELFWEMLRTIYHTDDVQGYEETYLDKYFAGNEDHIYVAVQEKEVVAYLSVEVYREDAYIYLDDLSVTGRCRDKGIGTKLIGMAEDYAKETGIKAIVFHVEKTNTGAHQLYKRLGYRDDEDQGSRIRMVREF
ncbi:MAG: GNAT family N-acetyltransferase [Lachnospiraceae bacterium]|nr:GNAT family N-acetyltransferase [Lachnospiraceae bacterium]